MRKLIQNFLICILSINAIHAQTVVNFTAPGTGTWTCPFGVTTLTVECWGGGGGGGGDNNVSTTTSGGGGGGGCSRQVLTVIPGNAYSYTVGVGGAGGHAAGGIGVSGTASTFFTVTANPGNGGGAGAASNGNGGAGGTGNLSNGTNGSAGVNNLSGMGGNSGTGSTSGFGGSSVNTNANGMNGGNPGGGGSGANHTSGGGKVGGNGGNGLIKLFYDIPPFVTRWDLSIPGSGTNQLTFNVATTSTVSYSWQELSPGSASGTGTFSGGTFNATGLPIGSVISLSINPTNFQKISINNGPDRSRLIDVEKWGAVSWIGMEFAFLGCNNLTISATDFPDLSGVSNMNSMFQGCTSLNGPLNINSWNTSSIINMSNMFSGATLFNQSLSNWNTATVSSMDFMFNGANSFNQNLGAWILNPNVVLNGMLNNTALNCDNYSATIVGWEINNPTVLARNLGANGLQYGTNAVAARNSLVSSKSWTITGDNPSALVCSASSPSITVNAGLSPFSQVVGAPSIAQNFVVSGVNLVNNIVVNAPVNYQVSLVSGSGYTNSVVINQNAGVVNNTTVFLRLNASVAGIHNGTITVASLGATSKTIAVNGQTYNGASNTCSTAYELCFGTSTVVSYPAATSGTGQTGPAYGCVTSQPNPTWLFFKTNSVITNSITSFVFSSSTNQDIDFILWGPISNFTNLCSAISNSATINGCSYSAASTETVTISNTQPNQYYVLLITNFASTAHFINITCTQGVNNICPIISADFSFPSSVCEGQAVTLTDLSSSNDGIDSWTYTSSAATPSVSSLQNPSFIFNTPGSFSISLTATSGTVSSTMTKTISVNSNPIVQSTISNTNTCIMSSISFTNTGALTYTLLPSNSFGSVITDVAATVGVNTYTLLGTDVNGCIGSTLLTTLTNSLPIISSSASNYSPCLGQSITLFHSGANTYTVLPINNTGTTITDIPGSVGVNTYTIIGEDNIGCTGQAIVLIDVLNLPNVVVSPSTATVCQGEGVSITLSGANSYTDAIGLVPAPVFTLYTGGSSVYTVSGQDNNGCVNTASASITVLNTPTVSISSSTTSICYAYTQTITANGADSYLWFNGVTTNTSVIQPLTNTTYSVIGINGGICKDTAYLSITVLPLPSVNASFTNTTICIGKSLTLSVSGSAINYVWTPGNLFGSNQIVTPNSSTNYTVIGQGTNGCANFDLVTVNVINPQPINTLVTPPLICPGNEATLSITGAIIPTWSVNATADKQIVSPISSTIYTYTAIDVNGCVLDVEFNVLINADCDVIVYNGLTPNGDGVNDFLRIENIEKIENNKVIIFNRWGKKITEITNYNNLDNYWDGKYQGNVVPSGTYFFCVFDSSNKELNKGWLEITY